MLGVNLETWNSREQWAFSNFAVVLALAPGVARLDQRGKALTRRHHSRQGRPERD